MHLNTKKTADDNKSIRVAIMTTSFPIVRGMTSGIFIQKLVHHLPCWIKASVIAPASLEKNDILQEKRYQLYLIRYGPRQWQRLAHQPGGIMVALKKHKLMYLLLPVLIIAMFIKCLRVSRHIDLVHANWSINGLIAGFAGFVSGIPVVTTIRGSDINNTKTSLLFRVILKCCLVLNSKIITVSEAILHKLSCSYPNYRDKLICIPNGVDSTLLNLPCEKEIRQKISLITIGNIVPNKGINVILKALYILSDKNVRLEVIGDGVEKQKLQDEAVYYGLDDLVRFLDFIPHSKIEKKLRYTDIFILSSYKEGRPNVLLEAMAAGIPVIASDIEGVRELIENDVNGVLFEPGNSRELSLRIKQLRDDLNLRYRLAKKAREFIKKNNLLWSETGQKYSELYKDVLERK